MKISGFLFFSLPLSLCLIFVSPASASLLQDIIPGGSGAPVLPCEEIDFTRPSFLLDENSGRFTFTKKLDPVFKQRVDGRLTTLVTAGNSAVSFMYPVKFENGRRTAFAFRQFKNTAKLMDNYQVDDTQLAFKGAGTSVAVAAEIWKIRAGIFSSTSSNKGEGVSRELNDNLSYLADDTTTAVSFKTKRRGFHVLAPIGRDFRAGYMKYSDEKKTSVNVFDSDDDFFIPANFTGSHEEFSLEFPAGNGWDFSLYFSRGEYEHRNPISYNRTREIGRWMSDINYDSRRLDMRKRKSENHEWRMGIEDYSGNFTAAGTLDVLGSYFNLFGGYYLFDAAGSMDVRTMSYSWKVNKKKYSYSCALGYSTGNASINYNGSHRTFFGFGILDSFADTGDYDIKIYRLGLGIDREITRGAVLKYSFLQVVPDVDKAGKVPAEDTIPEDKNIRGGATHTFSIDFSF